jgi:hypothetical protein
LSPVWGFVQTLRFKQASPTSAIVAAFPPTFSGHPKPNLVAVIVPFPVKDFGAAKRRLPTGGSANGIPKYSETSGFQSEACPMTDPLVVLTNWPIDHVCPNTPLIKVMSTRDESMIEELTVKKNSDVLNAETSPHIPILRNVEMLASVLS